MALIWCSVHHFCTVYPPEQSLSDVSLLCLVISTCAVPISSVGTRCLLQISYVSCRNSPLSLHYHSALLHRKPLSYLPLCFTYFTIEIPHHNYALSPFSVFLYDFI